MKNLLLFLWITLPLFSQSQSVGIGTELPNQSAMLDIFSTSKGLLIPRLTEAQKEAVLNPATGLLIWQSDGIPGFYYNKNTPEQPKWEMLSTAADIYWKLGGNAFTDPEQHFIGTTDAKPLMFRVRNAWAGQLDSGKATMFGFRTGWQNEMNTNTGFGHEVLYTNSTGIQNVGLGHRALFTNRGGNRNTGVGAFSLTENSVGDHNTGIGAHAMRKNTTGRFNTSLGAYALESNITGDSNVAVGAGALRYGAGNSRNTAVGVNALNLPQTNDNTAVGYFAVFQTQFGEYNTGVGSRALEKNLNGLGNTAIGYYAYHNGNYNWNTAIGYRTLQNNPNGTGNTAIGSNAMDGNTTATRSTALGYYAEIGGADRINATAIGHRSLAECSNCLILGSVVGKNTAEASVNVGIGTTNPQYRLQVGALGDGSQARANAWNTFSDARFKTNIIAIDHALEKVKALSGYYYNWNTGNDPSRQAGLMAQEVEKVLPEIVSTDSEGFKSVDYGKINALLLQAIKEQQVLIDLLMEKANIRK